MTGKSRHGMGKHQSQSKKKKISRRLDLERQRSSVIAARQQAVLQPSHESPPLESMPAPVAKSVTTQYPYVAIELRRIGILAGIMLVILVVLALILS